MAESTIKEQIIDGDRLSHKGRHAYFGAVQGFFVDMVDVYAPAIALAPAMAYFTPEVIPDSVAGILYYTSIVATLIGRPIGAMIFGSFSDRFGRRRITLFSISGFGLLTLGIAFLPGYAQWGILAPVILILLRFATGLFLGGEYTASFPLAFEYMPKRKRGLYGGILQGSYTWSYIFVSVIVLISLHYFPAGSPSSPYAQWGWRISFFAAVALALAFLVYRWRNLPESELWEASVKSKAPLRDLFTQRGSRGPFLQVFLIMSGMWLPGFMVSLVPVVLIQDMEIHSDTVTLALLIAYVFIFGAYIFSGVTSQRIGRRSYLMIFGVILGTIAPAGYWLFRSGIIESKWGLLALASALDMVVLSGFTAAVIYLNERFRTNIRAVGFGVGYSLSLIIPNFWAFYMLLLGKIMPYEQTGTVLLVIAGVLVVVGALIGPETKDVDFVPTTVEEQSEIRACSPIRSSPASS